MSLEFEREDAVQKLCAAYARDQITTGELEARLERVYKSADRGQLLTVLEGLPAIQIARLGDNSPNAMSAPNSFSPPRRASDSGFGLSATDSGESDAAPMRSPTSAYSSSRGLAAGEKRYASMFSEIKKEGAWFPARKIDARCWFGSIVFDLREATIPPEGIDMDIDVFAGDVKVILPPGLRADVDCSSFMSSVVDKSKEGLPGAPIIRVTGGAMMGGITVVTKSPRREGEQTFRAQLKGWLGLGESE